MTAHRHTKAIKLNAKTWANKFEARFLEAGIVSYEDQDCGKALLRQETISRCANSFVGRPLIIKHSRVTPGNMEQHAGGYITDVYYNDKDGWWYCKGIAHNDAAKAAIMRDGFVSCAYQVKNTRKGGSYHNISYQEEITDFDGEHLAIVDNPRYEGATIRLNSKTKTSMNVFKWFKKDAPKENAGADKLAAEKAAAEAASAKAKENSVGGELAADTEIEVSEGETVKLNDLVALHLAETEAQSQSVENSAAQPDGDSEIEINGEMVKLNDLVALHKKSKENAAKVVSSSALKNTTIKIARQNGASEVEQGSRPMSMEAKIARGKELMGLAKK